jgi:hypothetical protein
MHTFYVAMLHNTFLSLLCSCVAVVLVAVVVVVAMVLLAAVLVVARLCSYLQGEHGAYIL